MATITATVTLAALFLVACGDAPPPPAKAEPPRNVRIHVTNASRFDICRIEACGQAGKLLSEGGGQAGPLKPHDAALYEVKKCASTALKATACPNPEQPTPPCLKAEGGYVDEGTMFRVQPCSM